MTTTKFAKAIGTGRDFVVRRIKAGEIPATVVNKQHGNNKYYYDIDPKLVPYWKKLVSDKRLSPTSTNNQLDKREYISKDTPLRKATRRINELESNGISVSYGQAVAMGLIPG